MKPRTRSNAKTDENMSPMEGHHFPEAEKRRDERFDLRGEFTVDFCITPHQASHTAYGRDLSLRGVRMDSAVPVNVGSQIDLRIMLPKEFPGHSAIPLKAEVVRCVRRNEQGRYRIGCEIIHLTRDTEARLFEYLWWSYSEKYSEVLADKGA